ncbi:hypothetical protein AB0C52_12870 [Streptomyces sp. NPDC048717]|uniref:hypothetical protein n=1 Tax=Streptomyces sp. NPDC048717 TaxID=3154928 RepID=UPI00341A2514
MLQLVGLVPQVRTGAVDHAAHCATRALDIADRIGAPRCVDLVQATAADLVNPAG